MNGTARQVGLLLAGVILGGVLVAVVLPYFSDAGGEAPDGGGAEQEPLYWVAPMDPNYRRDKPGKSPMGMDLIPVYEQELSGPDEGPGTISISPEVVNNLGVRTALAENSVLELEVRTVGYVQYNQDQVVHIHPRVEGWIEEIYVKAQGEPVEKGQPLYEIYSPALVNAQEELLFGLTRQDARLIAAAEARLRSLNVSSSAISRLKKERVSRQTITYYAPSSGVVDNFNLREGLFVQPGMTLMSVGSLDEVWVEAEVFERQASLVREGLPVIIRLDYLPGKEWQGAVDYVYPTLDPKTRTLKVRMRFANPERMLKPNMFAEVTIHNQSDNQVLTVPREAVIRGGHGNRVVLALGEGRYKSVSVVTGRSDGERFEIIRGLKAGEAVVASAQFLLDSESSKTSDFKRMHMNEEEEQEQVATLPEKVWTEATINQVMAGHKMINVDHEAIAAWQWPAMTMDFFVTEQVDLDKLQPQMKLQIEISRDEQERYRISDVKLPGKTQEAP